MGTRGPIPNHSADLARPRERKGGDVQETAKGTRYPATIPEADDDWHPIARMIWDSLLESGQSDFYQSSDWAYAYSICEEISLYKKPLVNRTTGEEYYKRSGQMLQTINAALSDLLITEGHRRRVRMELDVAPEEATSLSVVAIDDYRTSLGVQE